MRSNSILRAQHIAGVCAVIALALLSSGCHPIKTKVYLMDGRVFKADKVDDDGTRLRFTVMKRHYDMPSRFGVDSRFDQPVYVFRILLSRYSLSVPGQAVETFDELYEFIDENIGPNRPCIIEIVEPHSWPPERRWDFTRHHGFPESRPYIGLEGQWIGDFDRLAEERY